MRSMQLGTGDVQSILPIDEPGSSSEVDPLETAARLLEKSGRFRLLRRLEPRPVKGNRPEGACGLKLGIVIDTETTGLDHSKDEIVEIGMVAFTYDDGGIREVVGRFEGLQQPSAPLAPEIVRLTGLTDEMLFGQRIDAKAVSAFVEDADLIVAHNAKFDRPFCENRFPIFRELRWGCSLAQVPWKSFGVEGQKLGVILGAYGLYHDGHRAVVDCDALLEVLAARPPNGRRPAFLHLQAAMARTTIEIFAFDSPFAAKEQLKSRGYRWNAGGDGRPKGWSVVVDEIDVHEEMRFLRQEIYRRQVDLPVRRQTARDRYRAEKESSNT